MTLFSRRIDYRKDEAARRKAKAHLILDRAVAGHEVSDREIEWALRVTGDLE